MTDDHSHDSDLATPQQLIDEAVKRKGSEYIRENFEAYVKPAKLLGYDISREDVEIPDDDEV